MIEFSTKKIEKDIGQIVCTWISLNNKPLDETSFNIYNESGDFIKDLANSFNKILKPGDVISTPPGFLQYNLLLHLKICDENKYSLLVRNIFETIKKYKEEGNLSKEFSIHLPEQLNKEKFLKCIEEYNYEIKTKIYAYDNKTKLQESPKGIKIGRALNFRTIFDCLKRKIKK